MTEISSAVERLDLVQALVDAIAGHVNAGDVTAAREATVLLTAVLDQAETDPVFCHACGTLVCHDECPDCEFVT